MPRPDWMAPVVRHLTHDAYLRRDGYRLGPHRRSLSETQYASPEDLSVLQLLRLRRLLESSYAGNEFYRRRMDHGGFGPKDLNRLEDLKALPILTKDDIRNGLSESFTTGFDRDNTVYKRTGGSTGVPIHVYWDYEAASIKKAATERHNRWAGLVPGPRLAAVWGDTSKPLPWKERLRQSLTDRPIFLDTLRFDAQSIERFLQRVRTLRPPILMGHAHSVYRLAEFVRDQGQTDVGFQSVITSAMKLEPVEREVIESVFQAPVFDRYGCEELSIIASECEAHDGLHIFAEGLYVEIVDGGEDRPGRLVITDLVNHAIPLIRYEVGDYATWARGTCPCGRGLPRLAEVTGRVADFLYTPDRTPVFGISILDTFVIHIPGFKQVQIVQDQYDHLDFYIVRDQKYSEDSDRVLATQVLEVFGPRMTYDVHFVERIEQTERGKFRFSICRIGEDGTDGR